MTMDEEDFRSILQRLRQNNAFRGISFHSKEFKPDKFLQGEGLTKEQVVELCGTLKVNKSLKSIINLEGRRKAIP
jgi:hypothetical protein